MENEVLEKLRSIPLFQAFHAQDDKLSAIAALMTTRRIPSGGILVAEGETGDELFILGKGEVEISRRTLDNEQYTVAILTDEDNAFFGELALLDEDKRSATISALRDCEVLTLKRDDFERFGNTHPEIALVIMRELAKLVCRRIRNTNEDVILLFEALVNEVRIKDTE